jgi:hypothetical protein
MASMSSVSAYSPPQVRPGLLTKGFWVFRLHDNALPHSAATTVNLLYSWGWEILPHPPYSPDLAPSDFHLVFPRMKKLLWGQPFHSNKDVQNEVKVTCPGHIFFFLWRTWQIYISLWQLSKQTWWLCGEVKLIWDCTSASWVTLCYYFI